MEILERRRAHREIDAMELRELDEIGLSRAQLRQIVDTPDEVVQRMTLMAERHGLSDEELDELRQDYAHLLATCAHCHATGTCAHFLADPAATADQATFCPNHADYTALAVHPA